MRAGHTNDRNAPECFEQVPATHGSYIGTAESPSQENNIYEMTVGIIAEFLNQQGVAGKEGANN